MTKCSKPDCDGEMRSRGMCHKHYLRWLRSDVPKPKLQTARELLLECMPGATSELIERTGLARSWAFRVIKQMHEAGEIYVSEFRHQGLKGGHYIQVWDAGPGEDAKLTRQERQKVSQWMLSEKLARKKVARRPNTWLSALGVPP